MARVERSLDERRRIGVPSDQKRIDALERVIAKLIAFSISRGELQGNDTAVKALNEIKEKLDQLDIDHPDPK